MGRGGGDIETVVRKQHRSKTRLHDVTYTIQHIELFERIRKSDIGVTIGNKARVP